MASYVKFSDFTEQLTKGKHDFASSTYKAALTNTAPTAASDASWLPGTTAPPPSNTNGYTSGGNTLSISVSETSGTTTVTPSDSTFTASGGTLGSFRYVLIYNDTQTSPADALVCYYDYGSSITLADTETFTIDFAVSGSGGLFTLV